MVKKPPLCKGRWPGASRGGGIVRLTAQGSGLPAWWGRSPLGGSFWRQKEPKDRLGLSPLRTSPGYEAGNASSTRSARAPCCGACLCHHTRFPWAAGPTDWAVSPSGPTPVDAAFPPPGVSPRYLPAFLCRPYGPTNQNPCRKAAHLNSSFFILHDSFSPTSSLRGTAHPARLSFCREIRSAIMAINSLLVGLPLVLDTV